MHSPCDLSGKLFYFPYNRSENFHWEETDESCSCRSIINTAKAKLLSLPCCFQWWNGNLPSILSFWDVSLSRVVYFRFKNSAKRQITDYVKTFNWWHFDGIPSNMFVSCHLRCENKHVVQL